MAKAKAGKGKPKTSVLPTYVPPPRPSRNKDPEFEVGAPIKAHYNACCDEHEFKGKITKVWPKLGEWDGYYSIKFDDDGSTVDKIHFSKSKGKGQGLTSMDAIKITTPVKLEGRKSSVCHACI